MRIKSPEQHTKERKERETKNRPTTSYTSDDVRMPTPPKLGYHAALAMWFLLPGGEIRNVGTCTNEEFTMFVCSCTPDMQNYQRRDLLNSLTFDAEIGRWYILEALQCHRPRLNVPIYASAEDAMLALA